MKSNIFLRSVRRQPVRAFILALIIGAACFSLTARVVEFVVVRGAIDRAESFYRAIGILTPMRHDNITHNHDVTHATQIINNNRRVHIADERVFTQGVLDGINNTVTPHHQQHFNPDLHGVDIPVMTHYFMGSIHTVPRMMPAASAATPTLTFMVRVDELLSGDRASMRYEDQVFTNRLGQTSTLLANHTVYVPLTDEEGEKFNRGEWSPFGDLRIGERALFSATALAVHNIDFSGTWWYLQPVVGESGLGYDWFYFGDNQFWGLGINEGQRDITEDLVYFVRDEDVHAYIYAGSFLYESIALHRQNVASVLVTGTRDMTAIPRLTDPQMARLLDSPRFPKGRWLTHEDYIENRAVAVIPAPLAIRRGIYVGDTLTITLRDNPRPYWIDTPTYSPWARGIENWWDSRANGWWGMTDGSHTNWRDFPTYEVEVEVVGIYWFAPGVSNNFTGTEIFVPTGLIPDGFGWNDTPLLTGMYSFVLASPRQEEAFLRETRVALAELGFTAQILPSGFAEFAAAIDPIRTSVTINLIVFSFVAVLAVILAVILYLRQWRKSLAIARALGLPASRTVRDLLRPVLYMWVPLSIAGNVSAWFFAINQAQEALHAVGEYRLDAVMHLPEWHWLAVLCVIIVVALNVGVGIGALIQVRRPVLEQLQGTTQKRIKHVDSGVVPNNFVLGNFELPQAITTTNAVIASGAGWRFIKRHILRTPQKTIPSLLLAILFVFALGWLNNTILSTEAEVAYLWDTTIIHGQIIEDPEMEAVAQTLWRATITPQVWDAVEATGFVQTAYLENLNIDSGVIVIGVNCINQFIAKNTKTAIDEQMGVFCDDMYIHFFHDFSISDFHAGRANIPVIKRAGLWGEAELPAPEDDPVAIMWEDALLMGMFYGGLRRGVNRFGDNNAVLIVPYDDLVAQTQGQWPFTGFGSLQTGRPLLLTATFTIDPTRNRELEQFREETRIVLQENTAGRIGNIPLVLILEDAVIDTVILPLEQNLTLLRVLFPIAIGVAFLLGLGLSLLVLLQNAKNAAIMRVLGKTKMATRFMLSIEQLIVCIVGAGIGLVALFLSGAVVSLTLFVLAGIYLLGAFIGTIVGAFVISAKAPLALLQVRE